MLFAVGAAAASAVGGVSLLTRRYLGPIPGVPVVFVAFLVGIAAAVAWMLWRMWTDRDEPGSITLSHAGAWLVVVAVDAAMSSVWPSAPGWVRALAGGALALLVFKIMRKLGL